MTDEEIAEKEAEYEKKMQTKQFMSAGTTRALVELEELYHLSRPYEFYERLEGVCIQWDAVFIQKILYAMSTDQLWHMEEEEKRIWKEFVLYQEETSTYAEDTTCNGEAIGCTISNEMGESYVVTSPGVIMDGKQGRDKILCARPTNRAVNASVLETLDTLIMNIYNIILEDKCGEIYELEELQGVDNTCKTSIGGALGTLWNKTGLWLAKCPIFRS